MTKEELLQEYNRVSNDPRQAQAFVKKLIESMGNINIEDLPKTNQDIDTLTSEEIELYKYKCIYSTAAESVLYPMIFAEGWCSWFSCINNNYYFATYYYNPDTNAWELDESWNVSLYDIAKVIGNPSNIPVDAPILEGLQINDNAYKVKSGTQLYNHHLVFNTDLDQNLSLNIVSRNKAVINDSNFISSIQYFESIDPATNLSYDGESLVVTNICRNSLTNHALFIGYNLSTDAFFHIDGFIEHIVSDTVIAL